MSLVGLGDSLPGGMGCSGACVDYVRLLGPIASEALGVPVSVTNLATNDGLGSGTLLTRVRTDQRERDAIAGADIVTLQVGRNDWFDGCYAPNLEPCLTAGEAKVATNLGAILDEVVALRDGRPTAIRVLDYYNAERDAATLPADWDFEATPEARAGFMAAYDPLLERLNGTICDIAAAHGATCVEVLYAFNGPDGTEDAAQYLQADHTHPNADGMRLLADLVAQAGWAPLGAPTP